MAEGPSNSSSEPHHWPYLHESQAGWLDPDRIAEQGRFLLYRALNLRQIVAFLGAGTSMAYGRISWSELAYKQAAHIVDFYGLENGRNHEYPDSEKTPNIDKIVRILNDQKEKYENGSDIDQVFCLNVCEQFWRNINIQNIEKLSIRLGLDKSFKSTTKPALAEDYGRACFQLSIKHDTFDERRNIQSILRGKFEPEQRRTNPKTDQLDLLSIDLLSATRIKAASGKPSEKDEWISVATQKLIDFSELDRVHLPGSRQSAAFFQRKVIKRQVGALSEEVARQPQESWALGIASKIFAVLDGLPSGTPVPPACYFMVGLALDLLRYQDTVAGDKVATNVWLNSLLLEPPDEMLRREEVIPKLYDPLHCLIQDLKVDRIATVNYDLEVERFLADSGYGVQAAIPAAGFASYERAGPLGARTRDIALDGDRAADLIDFAVSEDEYTVQVAHLHGRATFDSDLVVTERDYRNSYIHNGDVSDIYRQGLSILFGGNPVLFIGVGLNEEDLLRPLREFLSLEPDSNRPVLALMPALSSARDCQATAIKHFARYGIYVLHHGLAGENDWLYQIDRLCKNICGILKDAKDVTTAGLPPSLAQRRESVLADLHSLRGRQFVTMDGGGKAAQVDLALELEAIQCILDALGMLLATNQPTPHRQSLLEALRNWTFSAESAVLTKSLCGALLGIRQSWDEWWKDWKRIPEARNKSLPFTNLPCKSSHGNAVPPVIVRHYSIAPAVSEPAEPEALDPGQPDIAQAGGGSTAMSDISVVLAAHIIETINKRTKNSHSKQQVVLISGSKGAGKGFLFACLLDWIDKTRPTSHAGFFFAGFSFSCEVASVWDALISFVDPATRPTGAVQPQPGQAPARPPATNGAQSRLAPPPVVNQSRAVRLAAALAKARETGQRLLIVLNSIDMLFHRNGDAKNAEIHAIMRVLFGAEATAIDIVILVRADRCPQFLLPQSNGPERCVERYKEPIYQVGFDVVETVTWGNQSSIGGTSGNGLGAQIRLGQEITKPHSFSNIHFKLEPPETPEFGRTATLSVYSNYLLYLIDKNSGQRDKIKSDLDMGRLGQSHSLVRVFDAVTDYWYFNRISPDRLISAVEDFNNKIKDEIRFTEDLVRSADKTKTDKKEEEKSAASIFPNFPTALEQELAASAHLHEALIRHLAVISIPVPAIVLANCPVIEQIYQERTDPAHKHNDRHWRASRRHLLVALALHIMMQVKGMVFCIDSVDTGSTESRGSMLPRRYQVHRGLQHFVYNRLGAQVVEPVEGIFFTPSLPTSQARSMPQLNADAYIFLYEMVHRLSGYPSAGVGDRFRAGAMAFNLRAAMGVVRTLLSFGTVCRFSNLQSLPALGHGGIGQLERHRLLLRWMLVAATRCKDLSKGHTDQPAPPFYQDETAWLLNEIGVLSLIQGRCREADTFVSLAMNTSIAAEGCEGTMARRMKLNRGLCAIDLGRLTIARQCFDHVRYQNDEELLLRTLAEGYTAQVEHLCGNYVLAETEYAQAIKNLRKLEHTRPVSYLLRAEADLFRRVGRIDEAKQALEDSLRIAEAGGFNDYYHFSQLSEVRLNLATSAQLVDLLPTVDQAERYADRMDIPRLKIEALRTRAEVFLSQGETRLAGELAANAMRLAKLNDLVLRRISLTELMSRIFRRRGNLLAADRMQSLAERSARRVGYHMPGGKSW